MGSNVSLNLALSSSGVTTTISVSGSWMLPVVATDGGGLSSSTYNTRTDHSVVGRSVEMDTGDEHYLRYSFLRTGRRSRPYATTAHWWMQKSPEPGERGAKN